MAQLMNYWCPRCKKWVASADINLAKRHKSCNEKVQWREYRPCDEGCVLKGKPERE